eukprot:scaffold16654_cov63-Phaeocystis_antarctica.AAC.2
MKVSLAGGPVWQTVPKVSARALRPLGSRVQHTLGRARAARRPARLLGRRGGRCRLLARLRGDGDRGGRGGSGR